MMRTSRPLDGLFTRTRQGVLAAVFEQPDRWWYMRELAEFLGKRPSSLQRELAGLLRAGILRQRRDGKRVYYQAEANLPFFTELQSIMKKTLGIAQVLERALNRFGDRIQTAFIYGSVAAGLEHASSDVDAVVIGRCGLSELAPVLRDLERRMGRPINVLTYSPAEFAKKARSGDHFVNSLVNAQKNFLKGGADDLARLAGE
jgi:predicted nucleotidyltransferase